MPPRTTTTYVHRVPNRNPCQTQGLPQAELRPGRVPTRRITTRLSTSRITTMEPTYPTSRITTRELASWLTGWLGGLQPGNLSCAWLAGWLAGGWLAGRLRLREAQRGPERPREAQRCGAWIERACHAGILTYIGGLAGKLRI